MLRALSNDERLEVLGLLAANKSEPAGIASELGIPVAAVRRHLRALARVGLVREATASGDDGYALEPQVAGLLDGILAYGPGGDGLPLRRALPASVPRPPSDCLLCDNAGFVSGVLSDLSSALNKARTYHGRVQEMSSQVLTAHEAERKRIARELHDDTAQAITSILVRLRLLERSAQDDATVLKNVEELRELTADALDSVRRMAMDLRPAALDDLGLAPALRSYAEKQSQSGRMEVSVSVDGLRRRLPAEVELVLYRVVQEALTNVVKHASAKTARVSIKRRHNQVTLVVEDDGKGFDRDGTHSTGVSGLGLFGMRERLALVGGSLDVESEKGKGTRIIARVPLRRKEAATRA